MGDDIHQLLPLALIVSVVVLQTGSILSEEIKFHQLFQNFSMGSFTNKSLSHFAKHFHPACQVNVTVAWLVQHFFVLVLPNTTVWGRFTARFRAEFSNQLSSPLTKWALVGFVFDYRPFKGCNWKSGHACVDYNPLFWLTDPLSPQQLLLPSSVCSR